MDSIDDRKHQILKDQKTARGEFQFYENIYLQLDSNAKEYLKRQSMKYKKVLLNIQTTILPAVRKICPTCSIQCCKLFTPEPPVYIAGSVGGFGCVDYLLVRCDTNFPDPCYENAEKNLCPFFKNGCTLPIDCRSYLCIQYFCDDLKSEVDMGAISKYLEEAISILTRFSMKECLFSDLESS